MSVGVKTGEFPSQEGAADRARKLVDSHLRDLFWKLVELRSIPRDDRRLSVLVHGSLDLSNVVFQYDEAEGGSGRPICAKFLDFSTLTVSSPVVDISYFLHRAVHPVRDPTIVQDRFTIAFF